MNYGIVNLIHYYEFLKKTLVLLILKSSNEQAKLNILGLQAYIMKILKRKDKNKFKTIVIPGSEVGELAEIIPVVLVMLPHSS